MSRFRASGRGRLAGLLPLMAIGLLMPTRSAEGQEVGEVFRDCEVCPEMVVVPAGSFTMGSAETEEGRRDNEGPQRRVTFDYAFAVGVYEVTFDEWGACVQGGGCGGYQPDDWLGTGRLPVRDVHWEDAWQYADWLTQQTGEEYRLLSEAEWEYVARAGTQTARFWGDGTREQCQYANGDSSVGCRDRQVHGAGRLVPTETNIQRQPQFVRRGLGRRFALRRVDRDRGSWAACSHRYQIGRRGRLPQDAARRRHADRGQRRWRGRIGRAGGVSGTLRRGLPRLRHELRGWRGGGGIG